MLSRLPEISYRRQRSWSESPSGLPSAGVASGAATRADWAFIESVAGATFLICRGRQQNEGSAAPERQDVKKRRSSVERAGGPIDMVSPES